MLLGYAYRVSSLAHSREFFSGFPSSMLKRDGHWLAKAFSLLFTRSAMQGGRLMRGRGRESDEASSGYASEATLVAGLSC